MSFHQTRHVEADGLVRAECTVCGWSGQRWETELGAAREGEWHTDNPQFSGQHEAVRDVPE